MAVTDLRDVRVMIPRVRRSIDGAAADSSGSVAATLNDDQVKDLIADAVADVILYTGGVFGKSLEVTARDAAYMAPTEYRTSAELTLPEQSVIACQAALSFHYTALREMKVSERIVNEAVEWDYALSANVVRDIIKALQDARDRALEAVAAEGGVAVDGYASFLATRDQATSLAIEPWVAESGLGGAIISDTRPGFWGW